MITDVNCIQSVFPHCELKESEVTKKRLLTLNNIETNKTNKKQNKVNLTLMICYTQIKVLNVKILLITLLSSSAFNTEKFM